MTRVLAHDAARMTSVLKLPKVKVLRLSWTSPSSTGNNELVRILRLNVRPHHLGNVMIEVISTRKFEVLGSDPGRGRGLCQPAKCLDTIHEREAGFKVLLRRVPRERRSSASVANCALGTWRNNTSHD